MSENLIKQFPKLEIISQIPNLRRRKTLLKEFSEDPNFNKAIKEIVRNTLQKNIKIAESDKVKLRKYKSVILGLAKKQKTKGKVKNLVQQTGTGIFLPIVIPLVAAALEHLLR